MNSTSFEYINQRYLLGISDEPKQLLQPIAGYAREPLLSLEAACEPLLSIVHRLPPHIWIAKQNAKNPSDGLTQDESAAIRLYTMEWDTGDDEPRGSLYAQLNRTLKLIDRTKLRPWFRYLKLLLTALAKIPVAPRQTVWRGVRKDHSDDYPPGTESTWWSFSSCTTTLNVLESDLYLGNNGTRTLFSIEVFNGRNIRAHSHFTAEEEILLLPGTYFEVKSRLNPALDLHIIHLQQQRPPFDLLEPPFEGAELMPPSEPIKQPRPSLDVNDHFFKEDNRPWYQKHKKLLLIAGIIIPLIIVVVVLAAVLATQLDKKTPIDDNNNDNATVTSFLPNGTAPDPMSVADAFYAFDNNTFDLYSRRNGIVIGGPVNYIQGYVVYGTAIVLTGSSETKIQIQPGFDITADTSFTVEGFFMLGKTQSYTTVTLIQLTPTIAMILINGKLRLSLGSNIIIDSDSSILTSTWHHFCFVYDAKKQIANIYVDGDVIATRTSVKPEIISNTNNFSVIVGAGFNGYIDQLAIKLKAKSQMEILWDATTVGYYPLDEDYLIDKGPIGLNSTASNLLPVYGWHYNAINFNKSDSTYETRAFSVTGTPRRAFSIALWVRAEGQSGPFLTIANDYTCLLVLGLENGTNSLLAYSPNITTSGVGVTIQGPVMDLVWIHVAFTWSYENGAQLFTSGFFRGSDREGGTLVNARSDRNGSPMTVTLGKYNGKANCHGNQALDSSEEFKGSLDEIYMFGREIKQSEIQQILTPPPT